MIALTRGHPQPGARADEPIAIPRQPGESIYPDWMRPRPAVGPPRISGTAMPGGVFMSVGTDRTAGDTWLLLTGLSIAALGSGAMVLTYVVSWLLEQAWSLPLTPMLLMVPTSRLEAETAPWLQIVINLLMILSFLVLMRISPLSGYHAAEHKVISAIEHFGEPTMDGARQMPRAHRRCGSNLLAGLLPLLLFAQPLWSIDPVAGAAVIILGWGLRFHTGYLIQATFATKEPTDRQLRAGLEAGRKILRLWRERQGQPVAPLVSIWRRGLIQMFVGMMAGLSLANWIYSHYLHLWLDF
ncbi:MAG: DUF1385 domain-containing protein [Armatimonadota bacterium]|nr:DUF1385 domain-containing protein [Armatimonadota bacterium]